MATAREHAEAILFELVHARTKYQTHEGAAETADHIRRHADRLVADIGSTGDPGAQDRACKTATQVGALCVRLLEDHYPKPFNRDPGPCANPSPSQS